MDSNYQELATFKYAANLLYVESVIKQQNITYKVDKSCPEKLLVKSGDYSKALKIIEKLDLDESEVGDDSNGYLEGYEEWIKNQFVRGYFTGGRIPLWMYSKTYAQFYGPFIIISAIFWPALIGISLGGGITETPFIILLIIWCVYLYCGVMLTIRGFKKLN